MPHLTWSTWTCFWKDWKMGLPDDFITLLEVWLQNRFFYVEANGHNSIVLNSDIGTVQGSILVPILYALFIRPLYNLEKLTTFADDNYVIGYHKEKIWLWENLERNLWGSWSGWKTLDWKSTKRRSNYMFFIKIGIQMETWKLTTQLSYQSLRWMFWN